jgi:hypothetical protein
VHPYDAQIAARLNPSCSDAASHFEYGPTTAYGAQTAAHGAAAQLGPQRVSASLTGLQPGTVYHYRLVASNAVAGPILGKDSTFKTGCLVPAARATGSAQTSKNATLKATINPNGCATTYWFEYGRTTDYGFVNSGNLPEGAADRPISTHLKRLQGGIRYHFRLVARNAVGRTEGPDATFRTCKVTARRIQHALRRNRIVASIACYSSCTASAHGSIAGASKPIRLTKTSRSVGPNKHARLKLELSHTARVALKRAFKHRHVLRARLTVRVVDELGDVSVNKPRVRLKR